MTGCASLLPTCTQTERRLYFRYLCTGAFPFGSAAHYSQGIIVPKRICDAIGAALGDSFDNVWMELEDVNGFACAEQVRAMDLHARKHKHVGYLSPDEMNAILDRIGAVFGI